MVKRSVKIFAILLVLLVAVPAASAHRPLWGGQDITEIPDLSTSFAVYRDLETSEQADVYMFSAEKGTDLYAGINVPAVKGLEDYGVTVALVGPGLPYVDTSMIPLEMPENVGAQIYTSAVTEDFFEPFTQTNYWGRQRIETVLPETGTYYLVVWNSAGEVGKYVMDTGRAEVFGPADLFRFPIWWVRVHAFFGHTPYMVGAALLVVGLLVFAVMMKKRGGSNVQADPSSQTELESAFGLNR